MFGMKNTSSNIEILCPTFDKVLSIQFATTDPLNGRFHTMGGIDRSLQKLIDMDRFAPNEEALALSTHLA
jgi:hypothetical protein